ncbi:hypothetical protein FRB95_009310 [Tulasnella sp. JGI-2019a]|nr:hypothetical protein FRB95_009310 [Tulasnella sp. JGI-2019a]
MDSPALWGYIDPSQPRHVYLNALTRSKDAPLKVKYLPSHWNAAEPRDLQLFIESASMQVHHWQSAMLSLDFGPELSGALVSCLTNGSALLLEELVVIGTEARFPWGSEG